MTIDVIVPSKRISRFFSRKAGTYREHARFQRVALDRLAQLLRPRLGQDASVVDVGCGIGLLPEMLGKSGMRITGIDVAFAALRSFSLTGRQAVCADMDRLPLRPAVFNAAVLASTLQWSADPAGLLRSVHGIVRPGGLLAFSCFTTGTLAEFITARDKVAGISSAAFIDMTQLKRLLAGSGFAITTIEIIHRRYFYTTAAAAVRSLSSIGATAHDGERLGRSGIAALYEEYERRFRTADGVPVSYEAAVGMGEKAP